MATAKKTILQDVFDENRIISFYMDDVADSDGRPMNVYRFCKKHQIPESEFFRWFASLEHVQQRIWVKFFENAAAIMENEPSFATYPARDKILTLYFTLFEVLTLNRAYVLFSLRENGEGLRNLAQLRLLRVRFRSYITTVMPEGEHRIGARIRRYTDPAFAEGAWMQFLFILKFWLDDTSAGFEKTDILIEKSVNTVMDFLDTKPLENLFDLGKFLWKESKMR
jgi:hypothetical protein